MTIGKSDYRNKVMNRPAESPTIGLDKLMRAIPDINKPAGPPARQPTILVVEDHDDTREMLHTLLEIWGCRVLEACDGLQAVDVALREMPELILMDSRLPIIDGLEATRRIRENGLRHQVKILALNGSACPRYHAAALAAGCDDTIEKPFDLDRLRTYLDMLFNSSTSRRARSVTVR